MTGVVDTPEAVEAMANSCATTALAQKQRGLCCGETDCGGTCCAPACLFGETMRDLNNAAVMLRRLHTRAVDAERREQKALDLAERHMNEKHKAQRHAAADWDMLQSRISAAEAALATARADALNEAHWISRKKDDDIADAILALINKETPDDR